MKPCYKHLTKKQFQEKIAEAKQLLDPCRLCPRECRASRFSGRQGICGASGDLEVAHWQLHFGEEPPLSVSGGAGTVFFPHCNLKCVYCQNFQISQQKGTKHIISVADLAKIMCALQQKGSKNIDLVSPAHYAPMIVEAIYLASEAGLNIPIVYNTNGYDCVETLALFSGIVDIYLPDFKYIDDAVASKYSGVKDYVIFVKKAVKNMHEQAGDFFIHENGSFCRGLLVRHLVLPGQSEASRQILSFLKESIGIGIGLSLMSQYAPCYKSSRFAEINRKVCVEEYHEVVDFANDLGFEKCWIQELESNNVYFPDFERKKVFGE
ncbi:MAG: radical SAM protein [Candidatus Omnitrophica bacterium]|nr:radical SAM protein [Candidatus Omnitrophota bacterium]